jgi:predicted TIM-barrel fold metal-dependent hydrolase
MHCDSHVHVVGPISQNPQVAERTYLAGVAPLDKLIGLGRTGGIDRFVVVQPSFYGDDNTVLLNALKRLRENGRGVAVISPVSASHKQLADLHRGGVRGLRANLYSPLAGKPKEPLSRLFDALTAIAHRMNWHVEVIAPLPDLLRSADCLRCSPVPVVIDHYGLYGRERPNGVDGQGLLELAGLPHVWIKLSAPYRHDKGPLNVDPDREWVEAFLRTAPDRCVWGSDWPHPPPHDTHQGADAETPYRPLAYQSLLDCFKDAVGSELRVSAILERNAARLYGF